MKKISVKKYAQALYEATDDLTRAETAQAVENFFHLLAKNKSLKLADRIAAEFINYAKAQAGELDVTVISAQGLSSGLKQALTAQIKTNQSVKRVNLIEERDEELLGGLVVKIGDEILDASLRTKLDTLKQKLSQPI